MIENYILKSYYKDVFFEFLVHGYEEGWKRDAIIILPGFPGAAEYNNLIKFLYNRGFNVFFPKYTGTYQSKGKGFLEENIVKEITEFLKELKKGKAKNLWDNNIIKFSVGNIILLGGSFSGALSCGAGALDKDIRKIILFSPVWDFKKHNQDGDEQDIEKHLEFIRRAYRNLYRIKFKNESLIEKINQVPEASPDFYLNRLAGNETGILVFHDSEDKTTSINHTLNIIEKHPWIKLIKHSKGHDARNLGLIEERWQDILNFLRE